MRMRAGVTSDCGLIRPANEDSFVIRPGLYAVCDGMGGARAGEVASQMACLGMLALDPSTAGPRELRSAIVNVNKAIVGRSEAEEHLLGMGTTITVALIRGDTLVVAHVGDSRAYMLHAGELAQLTDDHSWVGEMVRRGEITPAQAAVHPHRSVITRALGTDGDVDPDVTDVPVAVGDRVLLCSDGLTGMVTDQRIAEILLQTEGPQETADSLVRAALEGGGEDNVTVIVIDVEADESGTAADGGAGAALDTKILIGPTDRTMSFATSSHRSRRAVASMRERLGLKAAPPLRPVGSRGGGATLPTPLEDLVAADEASTPSETEAAETVDISADLETATETAKPEAEKTGAEAPLVAPPAGETAGTAEVLAPEDGSAAAARRKKRRWLYWSLVVVLIVAIAIGALAWYNSTVYYIGADEGKVVLYHGLPATVLGVDLSAPVELSLVSYDSLAPYLKEQVDSHDLVSKEEGQSFLRTLSGDQ